MPNVQDDLISIYGATKGRIDDVTLRRHLSDLGYPDKALELFKVGLNAMRTNDYPAAIESLKKIKGSK